MMGYSAVWRGWTYIQSQSFFFRGMRSLTTVSNATKLIEVSTAATDKFCVTTISLKRQPVNSFNIALTSELTSTLIDVEKSGQTDAVIITSDIPGVFSAGLDLNDLYQTSRTHLESFWKCVQDMWIQLYSTKLPTVAAINGHCLAGGTVIASSCDHRIAVEGDYGLGVTAAKVGVIAPPWFLKMLTFLMGHRQTELALQQGKAFIPEEARKVGLVDEICAPELLQTKCTEALQPYLNTFPEARAHMKLSLRAKLIDEFLQSRDEDMDKFVSFVLRDSVQNQLGSYVQKLKSKSSKM